MIVCLLLGLAFTLLLVRPLYAQLGPEICDDGIDNDSDFLVDYEDPECNTSDDDRDGIPDLAEDDLTVDSDVDGDPDSRDADSDNDGAPDATEGHDSNGDGRADVAPGGVDGDGDGLDDAYDPDQGGVAAPLPNHDSDALPDWRDNDDDGDSVPTVAEDLDQNGAPMNDNTDGDSFPDYLDPDDDNDGIPTQREDANGDGNPANDDGNQDGIPDFRQPNDGVAGVAWRDQNGDGLRALSDPFIPNVTVVLVANTTQTPVLTATTTLTGWYRFAAPVGGVYYVDFSPPGRVLPTVRNQGSNEALDSDISRVGTEIKGRSALLTLGYTALFTNVDAGFMLPANLNVFVFEDLNRNGTRQVGEALVPGAMVILLNSAAEEITRGANDNNGSIRFADLAPGQYTLDISAPNLYQVDRDKLLTLPALVAGDELRYEVPLYLSANAVSLASFTAAWQAETIGIAWVTSAELQTQGYHLYRGVDDIFDHAQRVTTALIPGQGSTGGAYQVDFLYNPAYDPALETLRFWLVEVEVTGDQLRYGPIRVRSPIPSLFLPVAAVAP